MAAKKQWAKKWARKTKTSHRPFFRFGSRRKKFLGIF